MIATEAYGQLKERFPLAHEFGGLSISIWLLWSQDKAIRVLRMHGRRKLFSNQEKKETGGLETGYMHACSHHHTSSNQSVPTYIVSPNFNYIFNYESIRGLKH